MVIVHRVYCHRLTAIFDDHAIMRIDVVIILTVVLVIGRRNKQRIEIDHFNSQILQIIQLVPHALKITAVEAAHIHGRRIGAPVGYLMYRTPNIDILTFRHIVALVTVAEAVHKDLVHDRALCPLRRMKSRRNTKCIAALNIHSCAQTVKIADCAALHHLEIIALRLTVRLHAILVIVKQAVRIPSASPPVYSYLPQYKKPDRHHFLLCETGELPSHLRPVPPGIGNPASHPKTMPAGLFHFPDAHQT